MQSISNGASFELRRILQSARPVERNPNLPPEVLIALRVILNHVEPGWENCAEVVKQWLDAMRKEA